MNASFSEIAATIESADGVLVSSHVQPDGDALGSTLAFVLWLRGLRKEVTAWNEDGVTRRNTRYLPCHELIVAPNSGPRAFDVIVALDNSVKSRLGTVLDGVSWVRTLINIDHHVSNERYGDLNYVDPSARPQQGRSFTNFLLWKGGVVL